MRPALAAAPPELALLAEASRPKVSPELLLRKAEAVRDWDYFVALAARHGLATLAHLRLSKHCPGFVPGGAMDELRAYRRRSAARTLLLQAELDALLDELAARDVPVIPLRGPLMARRLYGDAALRECADLDLLVRREHRGLVADVLRSRGFVLVAPEGLRGPVPADDEGQWCFLREDGIYVEPHWELMPRTYPWGLRAEHVWEGASTANFDGHSVLQPSPEVEFALLCVHSAKHGWEFLSRVTDIAWYLQTQPLDGRLMAAVLEGARCKRAVAVTCVLAEACLGIEPPSWALDGECRKRAVALARRVAHSWADASGAEVSLGDWWLRWRILENPRDKADFLIRALFVPTAAEVELLRLPRRLWPLYHVFRACRVLLKYGARSVRIRRDKHR
ncbi:MAG: nucleotidyltransferase family protein [Bryobacterales bacterium]|nr:nucleotidyltransferase family protein [Bryobacterales bacterium]